jgi:hypothetical protein
MILKKWIAALLFPVFAACGVPQEATTSQTTEQSNQITTDRGDGYDALGLSDLNWKTVVMTGDDSITAFDNARKKIASMLPNYGVKSEEITHLSREAREQTGGVIATSIANFEAAMMDHNVGSDDGCAVHMTSHGNRSGFYIRGSGPLSPSKLDEILDNACGDRPTVVMISACYSGVFVDPLKGDNRVILTAASANRTSFGCSPEATYTYWDGCLIDHLPGSNTWTDLYANLQTCIERKERQGGFTPSQPQGFFGSQLRTARIFNK